uniref:Nucleophosmin/nucleoplasmin, 3 n=1 Tax=Astyanax mexicanus TaxID=7994 RepID=A0A3B1K0M5_ASTMX
MFRSLSVSVCAAHNSVSVQRFLGILWGNVVFRGRKLRRRRRGRAQLESYVFSCELSSEVPFYTFQGDEEEDLEHFLELRTICLGEGAKEENNVVEVTAMNHQGKKISVPVANLHISCLPMVSLGEFELMAPVTLRLKSGSGPVTVSGLHLLQKMMRRRKRLMKMRILWRKCPLLSQPRRNRNCRFTFYEDHEVL